MAGAARRKWSLTQEAFDSLLAKLSPDREAAADQYLEIHRNLVRLFEWRGCRTPDDYADESLNRCAKKICEGEEIRDVATYAIGVGRMLLREMERDRGREVISLDEASEPRTAPPEPNDGELREKCLRACLSELSPESRDLILGYYKGEQGEKIRNRRALIQLFGIQSNVLRMRALRIRERLQLCTAGCLQKREGNSL